MAESPQRKRWSTFALVSLGSTLALVGYVAGQHQSRATTDAVGSRGNVSASASRPANASAPVPLPSPAADESASCPLAIPSRPQGKLSETAQLRQMRELAARDHARALSLANAEPNWRLRTLLRNAALNGWASVAPEAAAQAVGALPERERRDATAAVFDGAANHPDSAAKIAQSLCTKDPALADNHARALIAALSEVGAFEVLSRFAAADNTGRASDWLNATFYQWAERDPAAAQRALNALSDPAQRQAAFAGLALGWSMANPQELAQYAVTLPEGESRSLAMRQALAQWMARDVDGVATWVQHFDPGPDFDQSAAAVATLPKFATEQPAVALGWAQSIVEPALRESTLTALAQQWAERQPASARRLIEQTPGLSPEDRRLLLTTLETPPAFGP